MTTIDIALPPLHPSQRTVADHPARFKILACGRRWGKTRLGAALCIETALRGGRAWWVAPTYKVARVGWRLIKQLAQQIPDATIRKVDMTVEFWQGEVAVRSADNPDALRGEGLDFVVIDECAYIKEAAWSEALRPALSDRRGNAMFISTPAGRNWFWKMWQIGQTEDDSEWKSWHFPTLDNPYIHESEVAAAKDDLPDQIFRQEYLAEFLEGEGTVFRNIPANMTAMQTTPEAHAGHRVVAGSDWARQQDFTAISIGCATCRQELDKDRFNKIEYAFQRDRIRAKCQKWGVSDLVVEENSIGLPNLEMLQRDGLPARGFQTTASSKPPLIQNLALSLEKEEWAFLPDPIWTAELEAYEQKVLPTTGRVSYSAPDGLHDDTVMARALMLRAAWSGDLQVF